VHSPRYHAYRRPAKSVDRLPVPSRTGKRPHCPRAGAGGHDHLAGLLKPGEAAGMSHPPGQDPQGACHLGSARSPGDRRIREDADTAVQNIVLMPELIVGGATRRP